MRDCIHEYSVEIMTQNLVNMYQAHIDAHTLTEKDCRES
jgi:hypothetical protein